VQVSSVVPDHLINLYETCITDLSASQIQKVQKLLNRYAGIFSKHDADYDRTSLIKHQIAMIPAHEYFHDVIVLLECFQHLECRLRD
jgi:hypothetical protein